jgi:hypothetical protein
LDGLDLAELDGICRRSVKATRQKLKFADLDKELTRAWKTAKGVGLDQSPALDVLDLGLGAGYFLYVCQRLGHRVVGLDRPDLPLWPQICGWLGVHTIVEHTIAPKRLRPDMGGRLDLITAFGCPFNYLELEHRLWTNGPFSSMICAIAFSSQMGALIRGFEPAPREAALFDELCRARGLSGSGYVRVFDRLH